MLELCTKFFVSLCVRTSRARWQLQEFLWTSGKMPAQRVEGWVWKEVCHATRQPHKSCHRLVRLARLGLSSVSGGGQYLVFELRILCVSATCSSHSARPPRRQAGNSATSLWPREGDNVARASATEALMTSSSLATMRRVYKDKNNCLICKDSQF